MPGRGRDGTARAPPVREVEETAYVRKADVDEEEKTSRLRGLKDQRAAAEGDIVDLQQEIEALGARIEDLTSFDSGTAFHARSGGDV